MTTPRDDIAGLSERLDHAAGLLLLNRSSEIELSTLHEAATQLDALSARVKELERQLRIVQNSAKTIAACQGTELEHLRQNKTFDHKLRAEHESLLTRDALMTEALEAAEARALRAEQERDEAYERLKPFAFSAEKLDDVADELQCNDEEPIGDVMWPDDQPTAGNIRAARDLLRRLASGPEKDFPPQEKI